MIPAISVPLRLVIEGLALNILRRQIIHLRPRHFFAAIHLMEHLNLRFPPMMLRLIEILVVETVSVLLAIAWSAVVVRVFVISLHLLLPS